MMLAARCLMTFIFFFSSRRRHTRLQGDWSSDVCSSDLYCGRLKGTVYLRKNSSTDRSDPAIFSTMAAIFSALLFPPAVDLFIHLNIEIGRASCRERV